MVENRSLETVRLKPMGEYTPYGRNLESEQYETYGLNTPNLNRSPESVWSKKRIAIILSSVFAFAAVSVGIAIGVIKGKIKSKYKKVLSKLIAS